MLCFHTKQQQKVNKSIRKVLRKQVFTIEIGNKRDEAIFENSIFYLFNLYLEKFSRISIIQGKERGTTSNCASCQLLKV